MHHFYLKNMITSRTGAVMLCSAQFVLGSMQWKIREPDFAMVFLLLIDVAADAEINIFLNT